MQQKVRHTQLLLGDNLLEASAHKNDQLRNGHEVHVHLEAELGGPLKRVGVQQHKAQRQRDGCGYMIKRWPD